MREAYFFCVAVVGEYACISGIFLCVIAVVKRDDEPNRCGTLCRHPVALRRFDALSRRFGEFRLGMYSARDALPSCA